MAVVAVGMCAVLGRLSLLPWMPVPVPGVHDEFSYLLAGDTFALGRLSNPPSPFWHHLETFHEIQIPSYASMYPPAQGLFLAAGKLLTGNSWPGVCISVALLCAAACWMLQGWVPTAWALFGGILAILRYAVVGYWVNSYWGGAAAALGAMLVIGSVPRLFRRPRLSVILAFSIGVVLLEASRPYEGMVFVGAICAWCLYRYARLQSGRKRTILRRTAVPIFACLLAGQIAMTGYFYAVTGHPFRMPYLLNAKQYLISRPFLWQHLQPEPAYRHPVMKSYYENGTAERYSRLRTVTGFLLETGNKVRSILLFYAWPGILLLLFAAPFARRAPAIKLCGITALALFVALSVEEWPMQFHYAAPMASVVFLATIVCLRYLWRNRRLASGAGRLPAILYAAICIAAVCLRAGAAIADLPVTADGWVPWATDKPGNLDRARLVAKLRSMPGKHLVFVRYEGGHDPSTEWVYNDPDLNRSKIIWAREISPQSDAAMASYYGDRTVWEVEPDLYPVKMAVVSKPRQSLISESSMRSR